ncbi:ABC transporter, ATPase, like protein [Aduncisulcus paluster]|uniref:ABC transporter, ATPase, like protein n=1 Tax=Aduncisulcus paluster TaxID=2918883 RepID=A0ABQ5K186_9EUKA|nr:ABC transporter, ATPase, like protein [Aduncisulcus paluster]
MGFNQCYSYSHSEDKACRDHYRGKYRGRARGRGIQHHGSRSFTESTDDFRYSGKRSSSKSTQDFSELMMTLEYLNGRNYALYKSIIGHWNYTEGVQFSMDIGFVQGDPHAPPTWVQIIITNAANKLPRRYFSTKIARVATSDYLQRILTRSLPFYTPKREGCCLKMVVPSCFVLQRSGVYITSSGTIIARLALNLPGKGRSILGNAAINSFCVALPKAVENTFFFASFLPSKEKPRFVDLQTMHKTVSCIEEQESLRSQLEKHDLIAFRSGVYITSSGTIIARLALNLPGKGRSILGNAAINSFCVALPKAVENTFFFASFLPSKEKPRFVDLKTMHKTVSCIEEQESLRSQLEKHDLIAFVANGSILPRKSGNIQQPLSLDAGAIPFRSPPSMKCSLTVQSFSASGDKLNQRSISGMGVKSGITLLCGGGFQGKSTLLDAMIMGVYNKYPGDGREFCVSRSDSVYVRAEDGRRVGGVDVSCFIGDLPSGKSTDYFESLNASGSTSQASSIIEALQSGSRTLFMDEDECATNLLGRDSLMDEFVPVEQEPIRTLLYNVSAMCSSSSPSSSQYSSKKYNILHEDKYKCKKLDDDSDKFHIDDSLIVDDEKEKIGHADDYHGEIELFAPLTDLGAPSNISIVLALGSSGEWLGVADSIIVMDHFQPYDGTEKGKALFLKRQPDKIKIGICPVTHAEKFELPPDRRILSSSSFKPIFGSHFSGNPRYKICTTHHVEFEQGLIQDFGGIRGLVEQGQTTLVCELIKYFSSSGIPGKPKNLSLEQLIKKIFLSWDDSPEDDLSADEKKKSNFHLPLTKYVSYMERGDLTYSREVDVFAFFNRIRKLKFERHEPKDSEYI